LLQEDPERRISGLRTLVTFGHATTQALQNLRSTEGDAFDEWYAPIREAMRNDALMRFFWTLRSRILKKGTTGDIRLAIRTSNNFETATLSLRIEDAPTTHLGAPIRDFSLEALASMYLTYLLSVLEAAEARFVGGRRRIG
jgi:hypothetical protein